MTTESAFYAANQRYLMAAIGVIAARLQQHANKSAESAAQASAALAQAEAAAEQARSAMPSPARLDELCARCQLSAFERAILLLCVGIELDARIALSCAALQGGEGGYPSFGLALAALPDPHWSALTPIAPLRRQRLIAVSAELSALPGLAQAPLRIDEQILHYLLGVSYLDERLLSYVQPVPLSESVATSHQALVARAQHFLVGQAAAAPLAQGALGARAAGNLIHLCGDDSEGALAVAAAVCTVLHRPLYRVRGSDLPRTLADRDQFLLLWERESLLRAPALLVDCAEAGTPEILEAAAALIQRAHGPLFVITKEPLSLRLPFLLRLEVRKPSPSEQIGLWQEAMARRGHADHETIRALVTHFNLSAGRISAAAMSAEARLAAGQAPDLRTAAWVECRDQARVQLDGLARRIEPIASWTDLVLPPAAERSLRQIIAQVRQRLRVYSEWGFGAKQQRGLGISVLFAGASGTGKTLAAEVLAGELGLDLYQIDLSQMVSKYIGETEKNLRRIFDAADESGGVLLFDEADALFGKRSEVKDSHDRYANIEVSYLLQRMEEYRGLAILTTNMRNALDDAFLRRLRFVVDFPYPDSRQRSEIWNRVFPEQTPRGSLDGLRLARLSLSGGNIRNIALNAAFLAAEQNEPVSMRHLAEAARSEHEKIEKAYNPAELGEWR